MMRAPDVPAYSVDGTGAERWRFYIVGGSQTLDVFRRPRAYLERGESTWMLRRTTRSGAHVGTDFARDRRGAERLANRLAGVTERNRATRAEARRRIAADDDTHGIWADALREADNRQIRLETPKGN
jgi:hypothetical protein